MPTFIAGKLTRLREGLAGPQWLSFLPAICLGAYWFGGEKALIVTALLLPIFVAFIYRLPQAVPEREATDGLTGLPHREAVLTTLDQILDARDVTGRTTACVMVEIDDYRAICAGYGDRAGEIVLQNAARRLEGVLRDHDVVARVETARFAIALAPIRRADLETLIQLSSRLQAALVEPYSIDAVKVYAGASIGFCLPNRAPAQSGAAFLDAAELALADARRQGGGAIRSYSAASMPHTLDKAVIQADVGDALENGQIVPWFQPQISTDTGEVSGMEALARWEHPERGVIAPGQFIPALDELGLIERLGEVMLYHSLIALKAWDQAGFPVPSVSVNFSPTELANPKLLEKIRWELDRFELDASRLTIEILESVISASDNDTITRNIARLKEMGCGVDLDDYGTGHASIANIRRFSVNRIKIDRSYVTRCDLDRDQQNMLAAILTMAERIDLETLAEGVETVGEHAMLAQLGCGHVQGFSVSRPLSFDKSLEWMASHREKLAQTPRIGRRAG